MDLKNVDLKEYGAYLLTMSFREWFLVLFKLCEKEKFVEDIIHKTTFRLFEKIYRQDSDAARVCLNQPPRSGKTTMIAYFMIFCSLINKCEFIYSSFSARIMKDCVERIRRVVASEAFKKLYGSCAFKYESSVIQGLEEFYDDEDIKNNVRFEQTKIYLGDSVINVVPLASTTGLGAGVRNADYYSGGVFLDDINKVLDTLRNMKLNQVVVDLFPNNVFTRLNNEFANILNCQQRITSKDLTSFLVSKYGFKCTSIPLIDENGKCNIDSQYSQSRIEELRLNHNVFMAQYQQEPVAEIEITFDGQMFDYQLLKEATKRNIPFEVNPYSCLGVDPKREGTDNFAIVYREGKYCKVLFNDKRAFDTKSAGDVVVRFYRQYQPMEVCIDSGKGEGLIDYLRDLDIPVREIKFNAESHRADAFNKRSAMYADVLKWLLAGGVLPDNAELIEDLTAQQLMQHEGNLIKLAPKDKIKDRIGRSPGLSDGLALTFAMPTNFSVAKKQFRFMRPVKKRNDKFLSG